MTHDPSRSIEYAEAVAAQADRFDAELADIRRRQDAGDVTIREAADERVRLMENHLAALRELRERYLGPGRG